MSGTDTEIQEMINSPGNKGLVELGPGVWKINNTLEVSHNRPLCIRGSGPTTILEAQDNVSTLLQMTGSLDSHNYTHHRAISDLVLTSTRPTSGTAIIAEHQGRLNISRVYIDKFKLGIHVKAGSEWEITDCRFFTARGILFDKCKIPDSPKYGVAVGILMKSCFFIPTDVGISIRGGSHDISMLQCKVIVGKQRVEDVEKHGDYGVLMEEGDNLRVIGCTIESAYKAQIYIIRGPGDSLVEGSWLGSGTGDSSGIRIEGDTARIGIHNNRIGGMKAAAISLDRVMGASITGNILADNLISVNGYQIHIDRSKSIVIANNVYEVGGRRLGLHKIDRSSHCIIEHNVEAG